MFKCDNAISQFKEGAEMKFTIKDSNNIPIRFHDKISEAFARLVRMKGVNSDNFGIQDGLLSNRIKSDLVLY